MFVGGESGSGLKLILTWCASGIPSKPFISVSNFGKIRFFIEKKQKPQNSGSGGHYRCKNKAKGRYMYMWHPPVSQTKANASPKSRLASQNRFVWVARSLKNINFSTKSKKKTNY